MRMGSLAGNVSSLQISRLSTSGGRLAVPVRPSQTVYAQFRHISGTPAGEGQRTVPLSKVSVLNSLIEGLRRVKSDPSFGQLAEGRSEEQTDAMIAHYAAELNQALKSAPQGFNSLPGAASAGLIFEVSA